MKNVKYVNNQENNQPSSEATEPQWNKEWVTLSHIGKGQHLQVRHKLDASALRRYRDMTKAGSIAPLIKVGRVDGRLFLIDGWHRMEVEAYEVTSGMFEEPQVRALVAELTEAQARWEAARANLGHGVQLKHKELREVFKAFIKAKKQFKAKGVRMSYRDMSTVLGIGHTTLRTWALKDFPGLARAMGGKEHGNSEADVPPRLILSLTEEHAQEATKFLMDYTQYASTLESPETRWFHLKALEAAAEKLRGLGVQEPAPADF